MTVAFARRTAFMVVPVVALAVAGGPLTGSALAAAPPPPITDAYFYDAGGALKTAAPSTAADRPTTCSVTYVTGQETALQSRVNSSAASGIADVICLTGTFKKRIIVPSKTSSNYLVLRNTPGQLAVFDMTGVSPPTNAGDTGVIQLIKAGYVKVIGLEIKNWKSGSKTASPSGIQVDDQDGTTTKVGRSNVYLLDNSVHDLGSTNPGTTSTTCGKFDWNAHGIAVRWDSKTDATKLSELHIENNQIYNTRLGASETLTVEGNIEKFIVAGNNIHDSDNIGIDVIGFYYGANATERGFSRARYGQVSGNTVTNVTSRLNPAYRIWYSGACRDNGLAAGGVYVDGAHSIWIHDNNISNTNTGIEAASEQPITGVGYADHVLIEYNSVIATTSAFGALTIGNVGAAQFVWAHGNWLTNQSQDFGYWGGTSFLTAQTAPVIEIQGKASNVSITDNDVNGAGNTAGINPLVFFDDGTYSGLWLDGNRYHLQSTNGTMFRVPKVASTTGLASQFVEFGTFAAYKAGNPLLWDATSTYS